MKVVTSIVLLALAFSFSVSVVSAHVVVKPNSVGVGSFQTFTMGVPVEKDEATTSLRLVMPEGLEYVTPNVKPGWSIDIKKDGQGVDAKVTEIIWSQGSIPPGQRDEFLFSAKAPATAGELHWKAYQTYKDGTVVSWDVNPKEKVTSDDDHAATGPYSVTTVGDDLKPTTLTVPETNETSGKMNILVLASFGLSVVALVTSLRKSKAV